MRQGFQAAFTKSVASLGGMLNEFYDYTDFSYFWWLNPFLECDYLRDPRRKYSIPFTWKERELVFEVMEWSVS